MSLQLLVNSQGSDCLEAKEKVHVIGNRLKLLLKEVTRDLRELAKILDITSSQQVGGRARGWKGIFRYCGLNIRFVFSVVRICHLGLLLMTWTHPDRSVPYLDGVLPVGDDR